MQAKDLANKDLIGKSDPYAVLFVRPLRDRVQTSKTIVRPLYDVYACFLYLIILVGLLILSGQRVESSMERELQIGRAHV